MRRVAILEPIAKDTPGAQERYTAFLEAFEQLGWAPGRNVQLEARWGEGDEAKTRKYATELIALAPDVKRHISLRYGPLSILLLVVASSLLWLISRLGHERGKPATAAVTLASPA